MKKLLVLALAGISTLTLLSPLYAADVKFSGEFRVRGFWADNITDFNKDAGDAQAFADERFRLRANVTSGIASGVVALDITNTFPNSPNVATFQNPSSSGGSGNTRLGTVGFGGSYDVVGVREAYLKFQFPAFGATAGRSPFKLGHGLILDDTADAISVNFNAGGFRIMLADLKICDRQSLDLTPLGSVNISCTTTPSAPGGTGGDSDFYIVNLGFNHMDEHMVNIFGGYLNDRGPNLTLNPAPGAAAPFAAPAGTTATQIWVLGAAADGSFGVVRLNLEADFLTGKFEGSAPGVDIKGLNLMGGAGLMVGPADVGVTVIWASGQDPTSATETNVNSISPNFVLGNILLNNGKTADREGSAPNFAGRGLFAVKLSAGFKNMPLGLPGGDVALIWAQTSEDVPGTGGRGASSDVGIEADVNFHHRFDENLMLNVGLGYLMPGNAIQNIAGFDDNAMQAGVGLTYSF